MAGTYNHTASLAYDANGNLTSVTDPRGGITAYGYNPVNRVVTRTDPLTQADSYTYDLSQNLTGHTDRRGKVHQFVYDALDRRTQAKYGQGLLGFESTVTLTYDAADRLTQAADSVTGTTTRSYDGHDRVTAETTPAGTVSYTYDAAGRRTTLAVAGKPAVSYTYDAADRVVSVTQGSASTTLGYDNADRRTSLTLPNGVTAAHAYDAADARIGISYTKAAAAVGDLGYAYDAAGRRTQVTGTLARTGLPDALASASYDANNRLTAWGGATLTYDAAGNLLADGTHTYGWDARGRLSVLDDVTIGTDGANFAYDALGRRERYVRTGVETDYVYDGLNVVQEQRVTRPVIGAPTRTVLADLLTGLGIDETYTRTDGAGAQNLLTDALGSTLALTDAAGTQTTSYTYQPYGAVTATGAASTNPFQYTGRENDGTGLYYYRARYYSPSLHRFISEDPIGLAGGLNTYAYVYGDPLGLIDPFGLDATVTLYPGAMGAGHVGIGVNTSATMGLYPAPGTRRRDVITGRTVPGVFQFDARRPKASIVIQTTPAQDMAMQDLMDKLRKNPGSYDLNERNCATAVQEVLREGDIDCPTTVLPKELMDAIRQGQCQ